MAGQSGAGGNDATIGREQIDEETEARFQIVFGRSAEPFESAMLLLGQNPFSREDSDKLLGVTDLQVEAYLRGDVEVSIPQPSGGIRDALRRWFGMGVR